MTRSRSRAGFTLIELMLVVAIISILASLAVPQFLYMQLRSRRAEAFVNLKGMAVAQEAYHHLYDAYVDTDTSPTTPLDRKAYPFDNQLAGWQDLSWEPDGWVRCHYGSQLFVNTNGTWARDTATCDMDDDNAIATWQIDHDPFKTSASSQHMVMRGNAATTTEQRY